MAMMIIDLFIALSLLGSYVRSDEVNTTVTIPPGSVLQDYLCSGPLQSNMAVVLEGGEHRIASQPTCNSIYTTTEGSVTMTGSLDSTKRTVVHCESKTRALFAFVSVHMLAMERITFINCGIQLESIENTLIVNCIFQDITSGAVSSSTTVLSDTRYGAVTLYGSTGSVTITDCTFQNNSAHGGVAVVLYGSTGDVSFTGCTFQNNSAGYGGAVVLYESTGDVSITGCTFQGNSAGHGGGAVMLDVSSGDVSITDCTFLNNSAGDGGAVVLLGSTGDVSITGCTFQGNSVGYGGAVMLDVSAGDVSITDCTLLNNSAGDGGAVRLNGRIANVTITDCTFHMNRGYVGGGAICIEGILYSMFRNVSITNNIAIAGAAIYTVDLDEGIIQLTLQDVVVKDNHCSSSSCAGAIYFKGVKMDIFGSPTTGSHFSYNSPQGAIQGEGGMLTLHGYVTFDHNKGVNGGAISLSNNVPLYFNFNSIVHFSNNIATGYGGAMYSNGKQNEYNRLYDPTCILRLHYTISPSLITFIHNRALQGGHAVYATPIYDCRESFIEPSHLFKDMNMMEYFNITPLPGDINDTQVLSFPENVNYCGCSDPNLCNGTSPHLTTYPGRTLKLNITSVDKRNNLSPGVVYTQVDTDGIHSQNIMLGPRQKAQWIGTVCAQIEYQIYGPENTSLKLLLSNDPNGSPTVINVKLLPCEPGFVLITNSSTNMMRCDCSPFLESLGVICDTSDGTVTRNKTNWIGVYNNTLPALAQTCPLDYCNSTIKKLSLARPGYLCNGGHTGIICGHCHGNLSVIFGSSKCQECSDKWLTTLVMFAVLGVFLVAALFFLNLTITQGTLYGLIFYANIIQVNTSIFFNQSILNPLQVIVSLVNLDLGLPMCF